MKICQKSKCTQMAFGNIDHSKSIPIEYWSKLHQKCIYKNIFPTIENSETLCYYHKKEKYFLDNAKKIAIEQQMKRNQEN